MSDRALLGLHHMTAVCGDAQENVQFYAGVLGLRLVKRTVNFDDPTAYHFYYGDANGTPGTLLTFFPYPRGQHGRPGTGQATLTTLAIRRPSLNYWQDRLKEHKLGNVRDGFDFEAPDGLRLRLTIAEGLPESVPFAGSTVPVEHSIHGIHSVTLEEEDFEPTRDVLVQVLGFRDLGAQGDTHLFTLGSGAAGERVLVRARRGGPTSRGGRGSVHHIAFRTRDEESQREWREDLIARGFEVSAVMDRDYFHSIYFREPGGVLFEIATDPPGFGVDEELSNLGTSLRLPKQYELYRDRIEKALPPIEAPVG